MKRALSSIMMLAGLMCLQGCAGGFAAHKNPEPHPQSWRLEISPRVGAGSANFTIRITNVASEDQLCRALDPEHHFHGDFHITSDGSNYTLVPKEKYVARVLGATYYNERPVLIKAGQSKVCSVNLRRDYVSAKSPPAMEQKWIREGLERGGTMSLRDRDIQNDWWDEIKDDDRWLVSASFHHRHMEPRRFPRSGFVIVVHECRSQDVKVHPRAN